MPSAGSGALVWSPVQLRTATDAAGVALWSWNFDTDEVHMDQRGHVMWDVPQNGALTFETLARQIHPPDLGLVRATFEATRSKPGPYEIDFRIECGEGIRWIAARGLGADEGMLDRTMLSIFLNITARKRADEFREMLADEMSHRVKNLFAIASSLTAIAARSAATTTEMARDLTRRLSMLAGAHDLIRPSGNAGTREASLVELFEVFLAPYDHADVIGDRIHISLPDVPVGESSAMVLALVVHELATNSAKYGSLSVASGSLTVSCAQHNGDATVTWAEQGGPPASAPEGPRGFGSKLISRSVIDELGGGIVYQWRPEGLVIELRLNKARLAT